MRCRVIGFVLRVKLRSSGRANHAREAITLLAEDKGMAIAPSIQISPTDRSGPFKLKIALENDFNFDGLLCIDIEKDESSSLLNRDKKCFSNREVISGVENAG